jgi:hypothetical protein
MASLPMRACPRYRPYSAVNMAWSLARFVLLDEGIRWAAAVLAVSASPPLGARPLLCDCLPSDGAQRAHASVPRMRPAAVSVCMTMTPCTWDERAASRAAQA